MTKYYGIYRTDYTDIVQVHQEYWSEGIAHSVDMLLTYPPYNTRRNTKRINFDHECLTVAAIASVLDPCGQVVTKGGNGLIFYPFMKFPDWYKNLCAIEETEEVEDGLGQKVTKTVQSRLFKGDEKQLIFICAKVNTIAIVGLLKSFVLIFVLSGFISDEMAEYREVI